MRSKTKIIVLHMKELIYTGIFILLGVLFLVLLILMFFPNKKSEQNSEATETMAYIPGVYTTSLILGQNAIELEVVLDENNINSIRLVNLNEAVTTMYPLIEPSFDDLVSQIYAGQPLDQISFSDENRYTSSVLLNAIRATLEKAAVPGSTDIQPDANSQPETGVLPDAQVQPTSDTPSETGIQQDTQFPLGTDQQDIQNPVNGEIQQSTETPVNNELQQNADTPNNDEVQQSAETPANNEVQQEADTPVNNEVQQDTETPTE